MSLEDFKSKKPKKAVMTNMSTRVTVSYRDEVKEFCAKHEINMADFMKYAMSKVMEDEKQRDKIL